MEFGSGHGVWEHGVSCTSVLSHVLFDFIAVDTLDAEIVNRLPRSIIVLLFVIVICFLFI